MTMDVQAREAAWYRRHGRYPERVRLTLSGEPFVIGDWSWNRDYPNRREVVEPAMRRAGVYREPKPKKCGACLAVKPASEFYTQKTGYLTWACKECTKARARKWQQDHPKRGRKLKLAS